MIHNYKLKKALRDYADPAKAEILRGFFKTGPGEYGEGDRFLGITVPRIREIARSHLEISHRQLEKLLHTKIHEYRLCALIILVKQFRISGEKERKDIFDFYLSNTAWINNWDLVDLSAHHIVGDYLLARKRDILYQLAQSDSLWERRIAVVATFAFIRNNDFSETFEISVRLLGDQQDLVQKAAGWMLREVGKRDEKILLSFLDKYSGLMPRTMLRYAIERLPDQQRKHYLAKKTQNR